MLERGISVSWLLIAAPITQIGCAPSSTQNDALSFCASVEGDGFSRPHLQIDSVNQTIEAFDVTYHLDDCSTDEFICLDGAIPFIQPLPGMDIANAQFELGSQTEVRTTITETGLLRVEIFKRAPAPQRHVTYNYAADFTVLSVKITDTVDGSEETTRYEPC
jgi:hypothetical protein